MRQLATMIAADLDDENCQRLLLDDHPVVTYNIFEKAYWPRLSQHATKGLGRLNLVLIHFALIKIA